MARSGGGLAAAWGRRELKLAKVGSRQPEGDPAKSGEILQIWRNWACGFGIPHFFYGMTEFEVSIRAGFTGSIPQTGGYYSGWPGLRDLLEVL